MRAGPATRRLPFDVAFAVKVLAFVTFGLAAFAVVALVMPPQSGPLALALVVEFQIFAVAIMVVVPAGVLSRSRLLRVAIVVMLVVATGRFSSEWVSVGSAQAADFTVVTWNLESGRRTGAEAVASLRLLEADVIALQELDPAVAGAAQSDAELAARFPYRFLAPENSTVGLGVLSRFPLRPVSRSLSPSFARLVVETPAGEITLIDAHPLPYLVALGRDGLPTFDPAWRNAEIAQIRSVVDGSLARGERVIVAGDFNTSSTEPEYSVLAAGLRDAHVEAGVGPGWTWRSPALPFLPIGLLRLDYQFAGGAVTPVSSSVDCSAKGDHCRLTAGYAIR